MQMVAWTASFFVFLSFFMKTMIPLRVMAIVSNLTFISYALLGIQEGVFDKVAAIFVLHCLLLPLNIVRLYQMKSLIREVKHAADSDDGVKFLIPHMSRREYPAEHVLFRQGDAADGIFFIQSGSVRLPEFGKTMGEGAVFGEVGIFSPDNVRAGTVVCAEDCIVYQISRDKVMQLYYQNPEFAFYMMRSVARIVQDNTEILARAGRVAEPAEA
ncbi:MAG: cyclic nucleotide-binding domain-containing protein [Leptospiraceae bacterium]|nr:cyclic nucleotide-binding domain-containing protein [Leptospiraceae bacterium]